MLRSMSEMEGETVKTWKRSSWNRKGLRTMMFVGGRTESWASFCVEAVMFFFFLSFWDFFSQFYLLNQHLF